MSDEEKTTVTDGEPTIKDYQDFAEKNKDAFKRVCPHGHGDCPHLAEPCPYYPQPYYVPYYPPYPSYPTSPYPYYSPYVWTVTSYGGKLM